MNRSHSPDFGSPEATKPKTYEFFGTERSRQELFSYIKTIADFLKENDIADIVLLDRSARPLYVGLREYWKSQYPDSEMPGIYFLNPKGFVSQTSLTLWDYAKFGEQYENETFEDSKELPSTVRAERDIDQEIQASMNGLYKDKNKPIMIFDTCIHTGSSIEAVQSKLQQHGFNNLMIGSITPASIDVQSAIQYILTSGRQPIREDFAATDSTPEYGCYPFYKDRMVQKTFSSIYSQRQPDEHMRRQAARLREEIKLIVDDNLVATTTAS